MRLQLALDLVDTNTALKIVDRTRASIDIVEIGTPMIISYGLEPVRAVKTAFPDLTVLADTKVMDAGAHETKIAFDAGADIATVMGVTHDETIEAAIESARSAGCDVLVDMMCVSDVAARAKTLVTMGARYICVHTAVDVRETDDSFEEMVIVKNAIGASHTAVAGGVGLATIDQIRTYQPEIVIVGSAITGQVDVGTAAAAIKDALNRTG